MNDPDLSLEDAMAMAQMSRFSEVDVNALASENSMLIEELKTFDPVKNAATFCGLLTFDDLQSNCIRLEALTHLALACGRGKLVPTRSFVTRAFRTRVNGVIV